MRFKNHSLLVGATLFLVVGLPFSCASPEKEAPTESNLTAGMAKSSIVKGETSQAEVLEVFGPPDLVTHKDDLQVWTYDKTSHTVEQESGYLTVLLAGGSRSKSTSSSTSTMLILYFNAEDTVVDYRLSVVKY